MKCIYTEDLSKPSRNLRTYAQDCVIEVKDGVIVHDAVGEALGSVRVKVNRKSFTVYAEGDIVPDFVENKIVSFSIRKSKE